MEDLHFYSGTKMLECERQVFSELFLKYNINPRDAAVYRLTNDLDVNEQITLISKECSVHEIILVNPIVDENKYPIEKCCAYALVKLK